MIDTHQIAAVAFDCDGVMFDSSDANRAYLQPAFGACRPFKDDTGAV